MGFPLETLKNFILKEKLHPLMTTIRAFFLQIRALFPNIRKRAGETSSPSPPLITRLRESCHISEIELFVETVNGFKYFDKNFKFLTGFWIHLSGYDSVLNIRLDQLHYLFNTSKLETETIFVAVAVVVVVCFFGFLLKMISSTTVKLFSFY